MIALAMFVALVVVQDRPTDAEQPIEITLERTACFGSCPVYTVTIDGDGAVTYDGRQFVRVSGRKTARITRDTVRALAAEFARIDFFALKDEYTAMVSDLPTVYVTLRQGDRTKRVKDYFGAPPALRNLERHIDEAAGVRQWVRIEAATVKELVRAGWRAGGEDGRKLLRGALESSRCWMKRSRGGATDGSPLT